MAKAKLAYYSVGLKDNSGSNVLGECVYSQVLDFSGGAATTTSALGEAMAANRDMVARITAIDAACNYAIGTTPDPDRTTGDNTSSAGDIILPGATLEVALPLGAKVAVKAVP
ncbi:hypothetical protein G3545_08405 [Starkeya sp. ORNL1]|uniref:hypothetical protein n=1 Tax=Starkeya sp. ORNL1 TaxID=2709380 RepID=UPI0014640CD8|nr:hypothetical protein [Starkeya sp. ORNL1]QJP13674.1 hypothetical protein G3545_08405 [Starkeya sp. ORNL1]